MTDWAVIIIALLIMVVVHYYHESRAPNAMCIPGLDADCGTASAFTNGGTANPGTPVVITEPASNLNHPWGSDTVPFGALAATTLTLYFVIFWGNACIMYYYDNTITSNKNKWLTVLIKGEVLLRSVLKAFAFSILTVEIVKNWVGRPRPNFLNHPDPEFDGSRSFPSGHAAFSLALGGLISFYLFHTLLSVQKVFYYSKYADDQEEFDENPLEHEHEYEIEMAKMLTVYNGDSYFFLALFIWLRNCQMVAFFVAVCPFLAALYVCATRISDYMHHPSDVLAGAFIGLVFAAMSFVYYQGEFYYGFTYNMDVLLNELGSTDDLTEVTQESKDEIDIVVANDNEEEDAVLGQE